MLELTFLSSCDEVIPELAEPGGLTFRPGSSTSARKVAPLSGAVDEEYNPVQIFKKTERQREAERESLANSYQLRVLHGIYEVAGQARVPKQLAICL